MPQSCSKISLGCNWSNLINKTACLILLSPLGYAAAAQPTHNTLGYNFGFLSGCSFRCLLIENNFAWHNFFGLLRPQGENIKKKRESHVWATSWEYTWQREREREKPRDSSCENGSLSQASAVPSAVISCTNAHFITWHLGGPAGSCLSLPLPSPLSTPYCRLGCHCCSLSRTFGRQCVSPSELSVCLLLPAC